MANNFGTLVNSELVYDILDDLKKDLRPILNLVKNFGEEEAKATLSGRSSPARLSESRTGAKPSLPICFLRAPATSRLTTWPSLTFW